MAAPCRHPETSRTWLTPSTLHGPARSYGTAHTTYFTEAGWKYTKGGSGVGWLANGGSYVTLTDGTDVTVVVEKMSWAHSVCIRPPTPEFATAPEVATFQLPAAWAGRTL